MKKRSRENSSRIILIAEGKWWNRFVASIRAQPINFYELEESVQQVKSLPGLAQAAECLDTRLIPRCGNNEKPLTLEKLCVNYRESFQRSWRYLGAACQMIVFGKLEWNLDSRDKPTQMMYHLCAKILYLQSNNDAFVAAFSTSPVLSDRKISQIYKREITFAICSG